MNTGARFITIMAREMRDGLFNPLVIGAVAALSLCLVLATAVSGDAWLWNLRQFEELNAPRESSPTANLGITIAVRPLPLHVIARGPGDSMSRPIGAMRQLEAAYNIKYNVGQERRQRDLVLSLADDIDPLFVLRLLLPILAMFISHAMICGEKETGTLRMLLANSVGRRVILLAKLVAGALLLTLATATACLAVLVTLWSFGLGIPGELGINALLIVLVILVYGLVFLLLGMAASAITHRADLSILVCLGIWVVLVIVVPGIAAGIAEITTGAPPAHLVYARKLALERAVRGGDAMEGDAAAMRAANAEALTAVGAIDAEFFEAVKRQERATVLYGLISPAQNFQVVATALAQSGLDEEREQMRQIRRYFIEIAAKDAPEQELFARTEPDTLPRFVYKPLPLHQVLAEALIPAAALLVMLLALTAFVIVWFDRYDVR